MQRLVFLQKKALSNLIDIEILFADNNYLSKDHVCLSLKNKIPLSTMSALSHPFIECIDIRGGEAILKGP